MSEDTSKNKTLISDTALVYGDARLAGNALIERTSDYLNIQNVCTAWREPNGKIGCSVEYKNLKFWVKLAIISFAKENKWNRP